MSEYEGELFHGRIALSIKISYFKVFSYFSIGCIISMTLSAVLYY